MALVKNNKAKIGETAEKQHLIHTFSAIIRKSPNLHQIHSTTKFSGSKYIFCFSRYIFIDSAPAGSLHCPMQNVKCKMQNAELWCRLRAKSRHRRLRSETRLGAQGFADNLSHFRRKYRNFTFCILNSAFRASARQTVI